MVKASHSCSEEREMEGETGKRGVKSERSTYFSPLEVSNSGRIWNLGVSIT